MSSSSGASEVSPVGTAARFRRVARGFTLRADAVHAGGWSSPSPCEGWLARDVVRHLTEWVPAFFADAGGPALPAAPPPRSDPAGAWRALDAALEALLDDPDQATLLIDHPHVGRHRFDVAAMEPLDGILRRSGQYGPRIAVPADADEQTRLIAFTGRQPWRR